MLEGLEATEIQFSDIDSPLRIDAEFFRKRYLLAIQKLSRLKHESLEKASVNIIHPTEVVRVYSDVGILIVRAQNVRDNVFDFTDEAFMPDAMRSVLVSNLIELDDVVMTRSGANYGQTACYKLDRAVYACADVLIIKPNKIPGGYLSTFLNTFYGKALVERGSYGAAQPHIAPAYLKTLPVPRFTKLEAKVDEIISKSVDVLRQGSALYAQAETLLLRELGLEGWQPPEPLTYQSTFSQAWGDERLDAEHFQPRYSAMLERVKQFASHWRRVEDFAAFCDRGTQPLYVDGGPLAVVNSRHILETGLDYDNFERTDAAQWDDPNFFSSRLNRGDILTYTTGAKIGRTATYLSDEKALGSNHVNILRLREENSIYVAVVLNSLVGRLQTRCQCTGSAQVEIYPSDIQNFVVPFIKEEAQTQIVEAVETAHQARRQAKQLLELAKRAVEVAIEDSEDAALALLAEADTEGQEALK